MGTKIISTFGILLGFIFPNIFTTTCTLEQCSCHKAFVTAGLRAI
jgi:hypothetical protein